MMPMLRNHTVSPLLVLTLTDEPMYSYNALLWGIALLPSTENGPAGLAGGFLAYSEVVP